MPESGTVDYTRAPTVMRCACESSALAPCDRQGGLVMPEDWNRCILGCMVCGRILTVDGAVIGRRFGCSS
jgi:hypothetical protein